MSALAGPDLDGEESLREDSAAGARDLRHGVGDAEGPRRGGGEWVDVEHVGWAPAGERGAAALRRSRPARSCGWSAAARRCSPRISGCWRRSQPRPAPPTRARAERRGGGGRDAGDVDRQRTALLAAVGHDLRTPLAGIKAAVGTLRQTDVEWSEAERGSCWRRSRSPPTASTAWSATCSTPAGSRPGR